MESSLIHTRHETSKIDPFNGAFFKRWQERIYSAINVVNLRHILTDPKSKSGYENCPKWENENKQVKHLILSTLINELLMLTVNIKLQNIFGM